MLVLGVRESPRCNSAGISQRSRRNPITGKSWRNHICFKLNKAPIRARPLCMCVHVWTCVLCRRRSADRCVLSKASSPKSVVGIGERRGPSVHRLLQAGATRGAGINPSLLDTRAPGHSPASEDGGTKRSGADFLKGDFQRRNRQSRGVEQGMEEERNTKRWSRSRQLLFLTGMSLHLRSKPPSAFGASPLSASHSC